MLHELDTYFSTSRRHSTHSCWTFDAGRHLNRCDAADDRDLSAACGQLVVTPYWSFIDAEVTADASW